MFMGSFTHTLDDKGRLTIPAKYRPELAAGVVITRGFDGNLVVYPKDEWLRFIERVRQLPVTDQDARNLRRLLFALATDTVPDKQGRILISADLREHAHVAGEAVVVGMDTCLEVWSPPVWRELLQRTQEQQSQSGWPVNLGI